MSTVRVIILFKQTLFYVYWFGAKWHYLLLVLYITFSAEHHSQIEVVTNILHEQSFAICMRPKDLPVFALKCLYFIYLLLLFDLVSL